MFINKVNKLKQMIFGGDNEVWDYIIILLRVWFDKIKNIDL